MDYMDKGLVVVGHHDAVTALAFSADGATLVSGSHDETLIVWDMRLGTMRRLLRLQSAVNGFALSPSGHLIVTDDGQVWDARSAKRVRRLRRAGEPLLFSPNGRMLARSSFNYEREDWAVILSDVTTGRQKSRFPLGNIHPSAMAFSSNGERLAVTGSSLENTSALADVTIVWQISSGQVLRSLQGYGIDALYSPSLSTCNQILALAFV